MHIFSHGGDRGSSIATYSRCLPCAATTLSCCGRRRRVCPSQPSTQPLPAFRQPCMCALRALRPPAAAEHTRWAALGRRRQRCRCHTPWRRRSVHARPACRAGERRFQRLAHSALTAPPKPGAAHCSRRLPAPYVRLRLGSSRRAVRPRRRGPRRAGGRSVAPAI